MPNIELSEANNRAEISAVLQVLRTDKRPLHIRPDSEITESGLRTLLAGGGWNALGDHADLWQQVAEELQGRETGDVRTRKVYSHLTWQQASAIGMTKEDWWGNRAADSLADKGLSLIHI